MQGLAACITAVLGEIPPVFEVFGMELISLGDWNGANFQPFAKGTEFV